MKISSIAVVGGLAALTSADLAKRDHVQTVVCTGETTTVSVTATATATVTVTVTAGASAAGSASGSGSGSGSGGSFNSLPPPYMHTTTTTAAGAAQTHKVDVGAAGELIYGPNQLNAAVGDVIEFNFLKLNHSVTQSTFDHPCTFNGGFDTGLNQFNPQNISGKFIRTFEVKDTEPTWFYCKQAAPVNHCGKGMVLGINPAGKMDQFIANAERQNGNLTGTATSTGTAGSSTSSASSSVTTVTVGLDHGKTLKFDPPFLQKKNVGDKIHFDFRFKNHTLTESSFDRPCTKLAGSTVDTNFHNVNLADIANQNATDLVLDTPSTKPRWFYCKQDNGTPQGHCGQGMVFAINTDETTFAQFLTKAEATLPKIKGRTLGPLGQI
ncbi:MAG: hypothetical protein M1838_004149 [Thelocarpon superellum]|nr:MAG: hypothetical protein M1838_004149 [Thelocarpon superellum]